ncbi:MAG: DNA polymerase III subunit gamma/tau [Rhabdochlamydiaceae bacterium]|nr:DNA polymerase III subunit gamma/tau [Candidatus Amphrikana amoebophyrae]
MTRYQVIAKRFRPQKFKNVFGQDPIIATLKNAIRMKRVAHAYLFTGSRGTGKTTLVRLFAKAINCHHLSDDFEPCNKCPSCLDIMSGRSLDILEIDGASNRGIDDIRQINDSVGYAATHGGYKIIIIDEVHMLTKEAFNALLKTLEEPPEMVKFFFATTEPHKVLSTISSRCQRFDLNRIPNSEMITKLTQICQELDVSIEADALKLIAKVAQGSLRDAESLLDQAICYQDGKVIHDSIAKMLGLLPIDIFAKIDTAYANSSHKDAFIIAHEIYNSGIDPIYFFSMLLDHYRNILLLHYGLNLESDNHSKAAIEIYKSGKAIYTQSAVDQIIQSICNILTKQGQAPSLGKVDIEMALLYIMKQKTRVNYDDLIAQLSNIQSKLNSTETQDIELKQVASEPIIIEKEVIKQTPLSPIFKEPPTTKSEPIKAAVIESLPQAEQVSLLNDTPSPVPITTFSPDPLISKATPNAPLPTTPPPLSGDHPKKHNREAILNFAAVELRGSLKIK